MTNEERAAYQREARLAVAAYAPDGVTEREEFLFVAGWLAAIEWKDDLSRSKGMEFGKQTGGTSEVGSSG